jgi:NAD(P)-dependent dehydrogenase (short-subunit alcohol dehydrogenase family)
MREPELAGQTVVLIGGSAGIGLETARRARVEGAHVILTGRTTSTAGSSSSPARHRRSSCHIQVTE